MFSALRSCLGFLFLGIAAATPTLFARDQTSSASVSRSDFEFQLGRSLSNKAAVYFPGESEFTNLTARWAENVTPDFVVSVLAGTEQDVATTVSPPPLHTWNTRISLHCHTGQICQKAQPRLPRNQPRTRDNEIIEHRQKRHTDQSSQSQ